MCQTSITYFFNEPIRARKLEGEVPAKTSASNPVLLYCNNELKRKEKAIMKCKMVTISRAPRNVILFQLTIIAVEIKFQVINKIRFMYFIPSVYDGMCAMNRKSARQILWNFVPIFNMLWMAKQIKFDFRHLETKCNCSHVCPILVPCFLY